MRFLIVTYLDINLTVIWIIKVGAYIMLSYIMHIIYIYYVNALTCYHMLEVA
jgi:hypothetical protein